MENAEVVQVSSSDSSDSSDGDSDGSEYVIDIDDKDNAQGQANSSSDDSELSDNEVDHDSVEEEPKNPATEESRYDKVIKLLAKGGDLNGLRLDECKAYLRKHGLRITGSKSVCIQRIHEHMKVKDGCGQNLYPRSSFVINCRGDVCTGDIVLFSQKVYEKYDLASRGGAQTPIGKRTIAGKIVKDSYGAAKQQHTFTVEILWSTGVKALPPLYPLLIKGRNLYRLQTYRQPWPNEAERAKVLAEKHARGDEARSTRATAKAQRGSKGNKHSQNSHISEPPWKRRRLEKLDSQKTPQHRVLNKKENCKTQRPLEEKNREKNSGRPNTTHPPHPREGPIEFSHPSVAGNSTQFRNTGNDHVKPRFARDQVHNEQTEVTSRSQTTHQYLAHAEPQRLGQFHHAENYPFGSTIRRPTLDHHRNPSSVWMPLNPVTNNCFLLPIHSNSMAEWTHRSGIFLPPQAHLGMPPLAMQSHIRATVPNMHISNGQPFGSFICSSSGCHDKGAKDCVNAACFRCCRRIGRKCNRHRIS